MFRPRNLALVVGLCLVLTSVPAARARSASDPRVFPPTARPHGLTYSEWSARWWQYYLELPAGENPLVDSTGTLCHVGVQHNVGLLLGSWVATEPVECTVPSGTMLLAQVISGECSTLEPPPFYGGDEAELRACVRSLRSTNEHATLDGVAIGSLDRYIIESPLFSFTLPENNIFGMPGGATGQSVARGIFLMLKPLSVGEHTLRLGATAPDLDFSVDITYHITVVPRGQF